MRRVFGFVVAVLAVTLLLSAGAKADDAGKPKIAKMCKQCHAPDEGILRGKLANRSNKAQTILVEIGPANWLVKFDDATEVKGADAVHGIEKGKEIAVSIDERGRDLYAKGISVKPAAELPEEKLMKVDELAKLIDEKADFVLVDSRPGKKFIEGHIPGAINIFDGAFDKNTDKLPKEKDTLLVFYCGGVT